MRASLPEGGRPTGFKDEFFEAVRDLVGAIEAKDPYTAGHTRRVTAYSFAIGREMGLSTTGLRELVMAAMLHDIGKVEISDRILQKKEPLEPSEAEEMNMHTKYGARLLADFEPLNGIIPGIRSHHERMDGKGYPDNLKGKDIPVIARIIAVADTFDAMTTDRPYRKASDVGDALKELQANAGRQFDQDVVSVFIRLWNKV
jgi:HD-GYP domain-containing protein (c-di-GMP phosphodiesterase class II)